MPDFLVETKNHLLVRSSDKNILKEYGIDIDCANSYDEILYLINKLIDDNEFMEDEVDSLDDIAQDIQERKYYQTTNK